MSDMKESISQNCARTGQWNSWDDLRAYGCMSAPVMVPRGSMICLGSEPNRFIQDTCVLRQGEEQEPV